MLDLISLLEASPNRGSVYAIQIFQNILSVSHSFFSIRDEIMADVQAMREEIFNPQAMRKIIKVVRDRELVSLQKVRILVSFFGTPLCILGKPKPFNKLCPMHYNEQKIHDKCCRHIAMCWGTLPIILKVIWDYNCCPAMQLHFV